MNVRASRQHRARVGGRLAGSCGICLGKLGGPMGDWPATCKRVGGTTGRCERRSSGARASASMGEMKDGREHRLLPPALSLVPSALRADACHAAPATKPSAECVSRGPNKCPNNTRQIAPRRRLLGARRRVAEQMRDADAARGEKSGCVPCTCTGVCSTLAVLGISAQLGTTSAKLGWIQSRFCPSHPFSSTRCAARSRR